MQVQAYAKLNLSLDILRRREDGYHDLQMVMQSISLADTLTITPGAGRMDTNLPTYPPTGATWPKRLPPHSGRPPVWTSKWTSPSKNASLCAPGWRGAVRTRQRYCGH